MAIELLEALLAEHGGRERWAQLRTVRASLSSGGLAFALHLQPQALKQLRVELQPQAQRVRLGDFHRLGWCGEWTPQRVALYDEQHRCVAQREAPRERFKAFARQLWWDRLDILYFAGYALWNYLSFPYLLTLPGVQLRSEGRQRLYAQFDGSIATHSREQVFHLDAALGLRRHDYTAQVIGSWARAANLCLASERVAGLRFYTRRKVYPSRGTLAAPLPFPTLVWIEIDDLLLEFAPSVIAAS